PRNLGRRSAISLDWSSQVKGEDFRLPCSAGFSSECTSRSALCPEGLINILLYKKGGSFHGCKLDCRHRQSSCRRRRGHLYPSLPSQRLAQTQQESPITWHQSVRWIPLANRLLGPGLMKWQGQVHWRKGISTITEPELASDQGTCIIHGHNRGP